MSKQLENLLDLYRNDNKRFKFDSDNTSNIEFIDKKFDNLLLSISFTTIDDIYYIFLYIEEDNKIIFKGLIDKSNLRMDDLYDEISNDLSSLGLDAFISKYYLKLKNNF